MLGDLYVWIFVCNFVVKVDVCSVGWDDVSWFERKLFILYLNGFFDYFENVN